MRGGGMVNSNAIEDDARLDRAAAHQVLRRLSRLLRPYRAQIVVATLVLIAQTACLLAGPALVRAGKVRRTAKTVEQIYVPAVGFLAQRRLAASGRGFPEARGADVARRVAVHLAPFARVNQGVGFPDRAA